MSMVRGKLEALREVSTRNMVVGDAFIFERNGQWFDTTNPNTPANVEIIKFEDLGNESARRSTNTKDDSK